MISCIVAWHHTDIIYDVDVRRHGEICCTATWRQIKISCILEWRHRETFCYLYRRTVCHKKEICWLVSWRHRDVNCTNVWRHRGSSFLSFLTSNRDKLQFCLTYWRDLLNGCMWRLTEIVCLVAWRNTEFPAFVVGDRHFEKPLRHTPNQLVKGTAPHGQCNEIKI